MRDSRLTRGFLKIVTAEDQEAWNGSLVDGTNNSQSNIEWIYGSPELDLLANMEIEAAHCALRHQAGSLDLFELVQAGETPIGPHVDLLRFRGNAWKLIADLMVNAAVNHERSNSNDMGNRGNFGPVSYGQRISQSHLRAADDANGGGCIFEHLVGKSWQTHQHREDKERYRNRKNREDSSSFGAEQVFENQRQIFRHISLLRLCRNLERSSRFCRYTAFFRSGEYSLVQAVNGRNWTDHEKSMRIAASIKGACMPKVPELIPISIGPSTKASAMREALMPRAAPGRSGETLLLMRAGILA